jgi:cephalosporin-C deacetylase
VTAFDLPLDQLRRYRPERTEPADFDDFWAQTLATSRAAGAAKPPRFERIETPLRTVTVDDVTFPGYAGQPIRGWFLAPASATAAKPLPTVVEYIGYGGGRSLPFEWLRWASAGYAHLVMDTRGQGGASSPGATPDVDSDSAGGQFPGFVTRGIVNPETWYYRRLVTDAILALDAAAAHPVADPERLLVTGQSQGGGLALAAAGLSTAVRAAAIDVPFLCSWRRALEITDEHPYQELTRYLSIHRDHEETVFRTLAYADGQNFAARANVPAFFSVGLMDMVCPPSTVFAAYNHYAGPKEIRVWPYNGHEAGQLSGQADRYAFFSGLGLAP